MRCTLMATVILACAEHAAEARINAKTALGRIMATARPRQEATAAQAAATLPPTEAPQRRLSELYTTQGDDWSESGTSVTDMQVNDDVLALAAATRASLAQASMSMYIASTSTTSENLGKLAIPEVLDQFVHDPPSNYGRCSCHNNPYFLWDTVHMDCFDPWHVVAAPDCASMCSCHDGNAGSGSNVNVSLDRSYKYSSTIRKCVDKAELEISGASLFDSGALQRVNGSLNPCVAAPTSNTTTACVDDATYIDPDGDGCEFYAASLDPMSACSFPGYEAALTRCPLSCSTCTATNTDTLNPLYTRYFSAHVGKWTVCSERNDLGGKLQPDTNRVAIEVDKPVSIAKCAQACASYVLDKKVECVSFSLGTPEGSNSSVCEFSSQCKSVHQLIANSAWQTFIMTPPASECDPTPTSPLRPDACGLCGGSNQTCAASIELLTEPRPISTAPALGSMIARSRFHEQPRASTDSPLAAQTSPHFSNVYVYLRLYGSKASTQQVLHTLGRPDIMFSFGNHLGGKRVDFPLAEPPVEDLGTIEKIKLWIVGGNHWLSRDDGEMFRGIHLRVTSSGKSVAYKVLLPTALSLDAELDQLVSIEWHLPSNGKKTLPTSVRRCYQDCTAGQQNEDDEKEPDQSDQGEGVAGPWPTGQYRGCTRSCTNVYDFGEHQGDTGKRCVPSSSTVCPDTWDPICGTDGQTYKNDCTSRAVCVATLYRGVCGVR